MALPPLAEVEPECVMRETVPTHVCGKTSHGFYVYTVRWEYVLAEDLFSALKLRLR